MCLVLHSGFYLMMTEAFLSFIHWQLYYNEELRRLWANICSLLHASILDTHITNDDNHKNFVLLLGSTSVSLVSFSFPLMYALLVMLFLLFTHCVCRRDAIFTTNKSLVVVRRMYIESLSFFSLLARIVSSAHTFNSVRTRVSSI